MFKPVIDNLEMIGGIRKNEFIQHDDEGNILSFLDGNYLNFMEDADEKKIAMNQAEIVVGDIICTDVPLMIDDLLESKSDDELRKVGTLLEKSVVGIKNLEYVYTNEKHLDIFQYLRNKICVREMDKIAKYLKLDV